MEVLTLLKANIKHKHGAFKSIIVLMLIISLCISVVMSLFDNQLSQYDRAFTREGDGDLVVFVKESEWGEEWIKKLEDSPLVDRTMSVFGVQSKYFKVNNAYSSNPITILEYDQSVNNFSLYNESCTGYADNPTAPKKGEVYLSLGMKSYNNCAIGDKVYFENGNAEKSYTVAGFFEDALLGAFVIGYKRVLMNGDDLNELREDCTENGALQKSGYVNIFRAEGVTLDAHDYSKELNEETGFLAHTHSSTSHDESQNYTTLFTKIFSGILYVFIILLFAVVLIIIGHSISTAIEMDYTNLGVLKSQGLSKGKIRLALLLQYVIALTIGANLGVFLAIPANIVFGNIFQPITGLLPTPDISIGKVIALISAILILSALYVILRTKKISRISPVRAISGGRESIYFASRISFPISGKALGFSTALRQFTSNKRQYVGTMLIVTIITYFMLSMTILANCMTPTAMSESFGVIIDDVYVLLGDDFDISEANNVKATIEEVIPVKESVYVKGDYFILNGEQLFADIYNDAKMYKSILTGRAPLYDNEIAITEIVSDKLGVKQGDMVNVSKNGNEAEYLVSGIYQSSNDIGNVFAISGAGAARIYDFTYTSAHFVLENGEKAEEVAKLLNERYEGQLTASENGKNDTMLAMIQTALNVCMTLIYIISIVFVLIIVTMVCEKSFLREKNDIGIYKSQGFTSKALRLQFALRFVIVAIIGSVIGTILSLLFCDPMMSALLKNMGVTRFSTDYNRLLLIIPIVLIFLCFFLFSYFSARKIKRVSVRTLITE